MADPQVRDRMIEVVLSHSVDGIAPGYVEYRQLAIAYGLPNVNKIRDVYGDYQEFAESIGLQTARSAKTPVASNREWREIKTAPRLITAESAQADARAMPFPFQAIDRGIRTWFDAQTHTQVTAHVLELR